MELAEVEPENMMIIKESFSTHMQILGLDALFSYHRQLNALGRLSDLPLPQLRELLIEDIEHLGPMGMVKMIVARPNKSR